jgi:hypothetical protein
MPEPDMKRHLEPGEKPSKVVWPTIGATRCGRLVGQLAAIRVGAGKFFTLGKVFAAATIPVSLGVFAWQLMPGVIRRYGLTNRRIVVLKGLTRVEERSIGLDEFDIVEIRVLPGQEWLHTGEVVFLRDGREVFRLSGVPRPETFRAICLKQRNTLLAMRDLGEQKGVPSAVAS